MSLLPEEYKQPVSENYVLFLLERALGGRGPNEHTRKLISGCTTVEQVMERISESDLIESVFLREKAATGMGNWGEFYIALRCEKEWAPRHGFDIWGAFEYQELIEVGKIEVKTCGPPSRGICWTPRITDTRQELKYDVLVVIGMLDSTIPPRPGCLSYPERL